MKTLKSVSIEVHVSNMSEEAGADLKSQLEGIAGVNSVELGHFRVAYKAHTDVIPVSDIYVWISTAAPYLIAAGLYAGKKAVDVLADVIKEWIREQARHPRKRIFIFGPDDRVIKCIEISGKTEKDYTERMQGQKKQVPDWMGPNKKR